MYEFTDDMDEISGFGNVTINGISGKGYEDCCRAALKAGCEWFDAHPHADPQFHGHENVYGILSDDNGDAAALSTHLMHAVEHLGGLTGAMHQAVIGHILFIHSHGWDAYRTMMMKKKRTIMLDYASRALPDGRTLTAYPLTFGRGRLSIGPTNTLFYDDGW